MNNKVGFKENRKKINKNPNRKCGFLHIWTIVDRIIFDFSHKKYNKISTK